ncbi:MAG: multicopper oxidase domain-containing protein [Acidobacteria bacterium]|nr:multicopper oxidase domain-containing protein [Acidobacteriota bacterium]
MKRRDFLLKGAGFAAALAATRDALGQARKTTRAAPPKYYESFSEPPVEYSRDGVLQTTLRVTEADVPIREAAGLRIERTRCYNGSIPGPTLKLRPGEELRLRLINELSPNKDAPCTGEHLNRPHCFNTTNIHTHGLHVSPKSPSDNSLLKIEPQTEYQYCFRLPDSHPSGTFWYHGHVHGSTGLQVMNGMSGALIVEDAKERELAPEAADRVWLLQEILGKQAEQLYNCEHPEAAYTVNGKFQPTLRLRPGEVQRWRFINATATPGGFVKLQLMNDESRALERLMLVAVDGYPLRRMEALTEYVLPPGGRADFLVQLSKAGRRTLWKRRYQGRAGDQVLASLEVAGRPLNMSLPQTLPPLSPFLNPIRDEELTGTKRTIRFQVCPEQARGETCKQYPNARLCRGNELVGNAFLIDGKPYDPDRIDQTIKLGAVEEWEIVNETGAEHPFHIHVNHFQVVRAGVSPEDWRWQDTVSLPANGSVKIRSRFRTFTGRYLLHCHILLHSDLGMMQNVEVIGEGAEPCQSI